MESQGLDSDLRLMQHVDMKDKVVLVRVDHNVVKKGVIKDPYRIDATLGTLYGIAAKGGRPVLMTHVGRPRDKRSGNIACRAEEAVDPIVRYLEKKLPIRIHTPRCPADPDRGILSLDPSVMGAVEDLRAGKTDMIYLPNTRWFQGEQATGPERMAFARQLADLADLYINDAFGSWQPHASTYEVSTLCPSFAGTLLQRELSNLHHVLHPERPFVGVIAGAKYDTKIGPLKALHKLADHLILGGLLYNTYLAAKHGVSIGGVSEEDRALASELVDLDKKSGKIVEMQYLVGSESGDGKGAGTRRTLDQGAFRPGEELPPIVDVHPRSLEEPAVRRVVDSAGTVFVNAVMGFMPEFYEGSQALYTLIASNARALKLYGGGDTLQELRNLCPGVYLRGLDDPNTYFFTGGGSVLTAIEKGSPYGLKPVQALLVGEADGPGRRPS